MKSGSDRKPEEPEVLWDLIDRCLLPLLFSHAAAIICSTLLNVLRISQISTISLFILFLALTLAITLFYHNLKVSTAGKFVIVTGCESKIGYAIAKHLDEQGLSVFAGFANSIEGKIKLKSECSGRLQTIDLDISNERSISSALTTVQQHTKGERDILKKSGTEEEYSERESLLEEVKSLKESTPLVPTGKRTIMDRRRDEGKKLRANAAAVLSEEVTDNSMVEEIYTRDENINFEWYDSSPTESGACAAAEEVVNTPIVNANSGVSYLVQSPGVWCIVNTGTWSVFGQSEWVPPSVYRKTLEMNLLGVISLNKAFLPMLRKTKGRIVNTCSILGRIPAGMRSPICVVTSALQSYTECLRIDMRKWGVDVILVETGHSTTAAWYDKKAMLDEAREMWVSLTEGQKEDYPPDYFEQQIRNLREYQNGPVELSPLLRTIADAVTRTFPLGRYTPVTKKEKLQSLVAYHLPQSVYSILYG